MASLRKFLDGGNSSAVILQTEAAECGLACIAMVASHWGHEIDLATLRRRYPVSLKGTTVRGLVNLASALNLQARPIRAELHHLPGIRLPFVAHWGLNHFVVVTKVGRDRVYLNDPSQGRRVVSLSQFSENFSGIAIELRPGSSFEPKQESSRVPLLQLMGRVIGLRRGIATLLAASIAIQLCLLAAPLYLQLVVDQAVASGDRGLALGLALGFGLLLVMRALLSAARSWISARFSADLSLQWLSNVFAQLMRLPIPYFENRHLGDIVNRFSSVYAIQRAVTVDFVAAVLDGFFALAIVVLMALYSPWLAIFAASAMTVYVLVRVSTFRIHRELKAEEIIHESRQQSLLIESIRGAQAIRLFQRAEQRRAGWLNALTDRFNAHLRIEQLRMVYNGSNTVVFGAERILAIWLAAHLVMDGRMTLGMIFAYMVYRDEFINRSSALVDRLVDWRMLRLDGERVADIVLTPPEEQGVLTHRTDDLPPLVEFRGVCFRYAATEEDVLDQLSFTIKPGECVAITGPSGCGKSTLAKLLLGLLTPDKGEIYIDGVPLKKFGVGNFRALTGSVMQSEQLFAGTIADNISFFDEEVNDDLMHRCAEMSAVDAEIKAMPMAYDTLVGDVGTGLSGGQIQRILVARALYKRPQIFIFDEATSNLDIVNEATISATLKDLSASRLLIAHRPQTIELADRVITLGSGGIVNEVRKGQDGRIDVSTVTISTSLDR